MKVNPAGMIAGLERKAEANSKWQLVTVPYVYGYAKCLQTARNPLTPPRPFRINLVDVEMIKAVDSAITHDP